MRQVQDVLENLQLLSPLPRSRQCVRLKNWKWSDFSLLNEKSSLFSLSNVINKIFLCPFFGKNHKPFYTLINKTEVVYLPCHCCCSFPVPNKGTDSIFFLIKHLPFRTSQILLCLHQRLARSPPLQCLCWRIAVSLGTFWPLLITQIVRNHWQECILRHPCTQARTWHAKRHRPTHKEMAPLHCQRTRVSTGYF